jgi:hypothetical protein
MLALAVTKLPEGPAWTYELKFDGYRALGIRETVRSDCCRATAKTSPSVSPGSRLHSKNSLTRLPSTARSSLTTATDALRFNVLQNYRNIGPEIHLYVFDLLTLHGKDAGHAECVRHHRGPAE